MEKQQQQKPTDCQPANSNSEHSQLPHTKDRFLFQQNTFLTPRSDSLSQRQTHKTTVFHKKTPSKSDTYTVCM